MLSTDPPDNGCFFNSGLLTPKKHINSNVYTPFTCKFAFVIFCIKGNEG